MVIVVGNGLSDTISFLERMFTYRIAQILSGKSCIKIFSLPLLENSWADFFFWYGNR